MNSDNKILALNWAKAQIPREACGVVIVEAGLEVFVPCKNISPYIDMFDIDPEDYARAEDRGEIIEIFHSHCYGSPQPSIVDKTICEQTGMRWSIVSVPNGDWFEFEPTGYKAPLVGRQWAHGSLDCYSLLQDYYKEKLNIDLPNFDRNFEWWLKGEDLYSKNFELSGFRVIDPKEIQLHDIILMQLRSPVINHGGVFIGDRMFIHHIHRRLSCRDIWDGYWRKNTIKVVRHFSL